MFLFYLRIIIHICPPLVQQNIVWGGIINSVTLSSAVLSINKYGFIIWGTFY